MGRSLVYKIPLPFTLEQYSRGILYTTTEVSRRETGKGSGIEVLLNQTQPFTLPPDSSTRTPATPVECQYTKKIYHMERMTPAFIKSLAMKMYGKNILKFTEESHNAYPFMFTQSENLEQPDRFSCTVISVHLADKGDCAKPRFLHDHPFLKSHKKPYEKVPVRVLDITKEIEGEKSKFKYDPTTFRSQQLGIGPLPASDKKTPWWDKWEGPMMCCYKYTYLDINFFPMSSKMEKTFFKNQELALLKMHKQMFCFLDTWGRMSMEEVQRFEHEVGAQLATLLHKEDVRFEYEVADDQPAAAGADKSMDKSDVTPNLSNPPVAPSSPAAAVADLTPASGAAAQLPAPAAVSASSSDNEPDPAAAAQQPDALTPVPA